MYMEIKKMFREKRKDKAQQYIYQRQESKDDFNLWIQWLGYDGSNTISKNN